MSQGDALYSNVRHALEKAFERVGDEDEPVKSIDPSTLGAELFNHGTKAPSDMNRMDWAAEHGLTHLCVIEALGGRGNDRYLALKAKYCYNLLLRQEAINELARRTRMKALSFTQKRAVISMWATGVKITYKMIDQGDGAATSTIQRRLETVRDQVIAWHNAGIKAVEAELEKTQRLQIHA